MPTDDTGDDGPPKPLWDLAPKMLRETQDHLAGSDPGFITESQVKPSPMQEISTNTDTRAPRLCQATRTGPLVKEGAVGPKAKLLHEVLPLVISTQTHKKKNVQTYFPLTVLLPKSKNLWF